MRKTSAIVLLACMGMFPACAMDFEDKPEVGSTEQDILLGNLTLPSSGMMTVTGTLYPGVSDLIVHSPSAGTWVLKAWGDNGTAFNCFNPGWPPATPDGLFKVFWRDESNLNNPWNAFTSGGALCPQIIADLTATSLYSGSSTIGYKVTFTVNVSNVIYFGAEFTKQ